MLDVDGAPADSLLSIRVGGQCRQGSTASRKPYKFSVHPDDAGMFKVDVLVPVGSARIVARPGAREYVVPIDCGDGSGKTMELKLGVTSAAEGAAAKGSSPGELPDSDGTSKRHNVALEARDYLDEHKLTPFIQSLLQGMLKTKPKDPYVWMTQQLLSATKVEPISAQPCQQSPLVQLNRCPRKVGGSAVITGPSGVGKSTLIKRLMANHPGRFGLAVPHTTRDPMSGERPGVDYHFVSKEQIQRDMQGGLFIEYAEVQGNYYGTSMEAVGAVNAQGMVCILDIDVQGADSVRASSLHESASYIFLAPPNLRVLEQRLRVRGTETEEEVLKRLAGAERELAALEAKPDAWDMVLRWQNKDVDRACMEFQRFLELQIPSDLAVIRRNPGTIGGSTVVCGPSGVGKSTLIRRLLADFPDRFGFSVSHTTREPRPGERDGVDYHFVSRELMQREIQAGNFIEHAEVHGNLYGTSVAAVESVMGGGMVCLLDIDIQGAESIRRSGLHTSTSYCFFLPPDMAVLEQRLRGRRAETEEKVQKRLADARQEMAIYEASPESWDLTVRNEDLDRAYLQFRRYVERQLSGSARSVEELRSVARSVLIDAAGTGLLDHAFGDVFGGGLSAAEALAGEEEAIIAACDTLHCDDCCCLSAADALAGEEKEEEEAPDPSYRPKMGALRKPPAGEVVEVATVAELPLGKTLYAFLVSAVVPRPIAFVSTISADGVANLAPFSFYGVMSHDPPTLVFCPIYRQGKPKDTLANCQANGECVVNMISEHFVEAANCCCGEYPPEVDEFELSGLTRVPSKLPRGTPRVQEAMVQFECKVAEVKELIGASGVGSCAIVICQILRVHAHSAILRKTPNGSDYVDINDYKPISRLGGNDYGRTSGAFDMPRPPADLWKTAVL